MTPKKPVFDLEAEIERARRIPLENCDSPIEDEFLWEFKKVASDEVRLERQFECRTAIGTFFLDFVIIHISTGRQVGIECDGKDFHSEARDCKRDAAIVAACPVDRIYRLKGKDINFRIHHTLHLLSRCELSLFSQRGLQNLAILCGPESMREDWFGPSGRHFPFIASRQYLSRNRPREGYKGDFDYDGYEDNQDDGLKSPTSIFFTQQANSPKSKND